MITDDLMTIDPDVVTPDTPLREAVALMNKHDRRQLLVVQEGKLVGILTDRDIRLAVNSPLLSKEADARSEVLNQFTAVSCMTKNPVTVTPQTPIHEVARILAERKFGALPVVEGEELVGIITVTDLLNWMALIPER